MQKLAKATYRYWVFDVLYFSKSPSKAWAMEKLNRLRVFICHAKEDKASARELHKRLHDDGIDAWLDEDDLLPGENWKLEIEKAVKSSHVVLVLLSQTSTTKSGFVQKELKIALNVAEEQPEGAIFIIPIKLEECESPYKLKTLQWLEYFNPKSYELLMKSLTARARLVGVALPNPSYTTVSRLILQKEEGNNFIQLYSFPNDSGPYALLFKKNLLFVANWHGGNITIVEPRT